LFAVRCSLFAETLSNRIQRVNSLIKNEISKILLKGVDFPRDVLITVTRVETLVNLEQAKVYVSVMPEEQAKRVFKILNRKVYELQQMLNKRLKMRSVPRIKFEKEEKTREAARVEELLEKIKNDRENRNVTNF